MNKEHIQISFTKTSDNYETCVLCGDITEVKQRMPIDARKYYIDGIGQLCSKCYLDLNESNMDTKNEKY